MTDIEFTVDETEAGSRVDVFVAEKSGYSRSYVQKCFTDGLICINGKLKSKKDILKSGDVVCLNITPPTEIEAVPQNIPLDIVYEDNYLLVVNKPKGMVVHPAPGNPDETLVNALLYHCAGNLSGINGKIRPGIVHRIDKDTSGLLIVAKTDEAHRGLADQIARHSFVRRYEAVVCGHFTQDDFTVNLPIGRHPIDRKRMAVTELNSRNAITHCHVIKRFQGYSHMELTLETGRTHQIRVHMAYLGHPVAGDTVYGPHQKVIPNLNGQCLFARYISFKHPVTNDVLSFEADLPEFFINTLNLLKPE